MDDKGKKDAANLSAPHEKWQEKLAPKSGQAPTGVSSYVGLLRQNPSDADTYELFQTLDMSSSLSIRKEDVVHLEELPPERSPFGTLGGSKVFVKMGATITSVRTSRSTLTAGSDTPDDFDLDIRLGARSSHVTKKPPQTIPDTGCGDVCTKIPPFTDPDVGPCMTAPATFCGCTQQCTKDTCVCIPTQAGGSVCRCGPFTQDCATVLAQTCATCQTCNENTCQTCQTNCGTCHTCNTCQTKCGGETCVACTHIFTQCNQHTCLVR